MGQSDGSRAQSGKCGWALTPTVVVVVEFISTVQHNNNIYTHIIWYEISSKIIIIK